jgi:5-methylcytosine-specific restriction endonuclease McrA
MHPRPTSPRKAKGIFTRIRAQLFAADPHCYYCRCLTQLPTGDERCSHTATIDHKTPISKGGRKASMANLALCCYACNQAKGDSTEEEFRAAR